MQQAITDCKTVLLFDYLALGFAIGGYFVDKCVLAIVLNLRSFFNFCCCRLCKCADGQRDLVILGVDSGDLCLDNVADGENLFGLADAAVCDLRNVDKAVNAGQDFCKCTEGHELYNLDLSGIADIVVGGKLDPGILVGILITEGDLFLLLVEANDIDIDLVADIEYFGRILDAAPEPYRRCRRYRRMHRSWSWTLRHRDTYCRPPSRSR